jgi:hypothetical protein
LWQDRDWRIDTFDFARTLLGSDELPTALDNGQRSPWKLTGAV